MATQSVGSNRVAEIELERGDLEQADSSQDVVSTRTYSRSLWQRHTNPSVREYSKAGLAPCRTSSVYH
jgi:hypothetical protein